MSQQLEWKVSPATLARVFETWGRTSKRELPWRAPGVTPFGLLLAEVLVRQTRAENAASAWEELIELCPGPLELFDIEESVLYPILQPLGLGRQRTRILKLLANALVKRGSSVPASVDELLALPHVGLYTAHAVACFAFGQRVPIVDVNVLRVLGRVEGLKFHPDNREAPGAWELAGAMVQEASSAVDANYGLLDFAARPCRPRNPLCGECPLVGVCDWAIRNHRTAD